MEVGTLASKAVPLKDGSRVPVAIWHEQIVAILIAWGMRPSDAETTAEVLTSADLAGIDSHGASMLALYARHFSEGTAVPCPDIRIERDAGALALIDAGAGLGHVPGVMATDMAAERAERLGIGAVAVRNSNHYGAAGVYARRLAERGLIGLSTSSVWTKAIVPTGGRRSQLGTNPIAFAAPTGTGRPFLLDMATSTVAIGKLRLAERAGKPIPEGWAMTPEGEPETDPTRALALADRLLAPLGGHKGYGLAVMAEVLSSTLSGAIQTPLRDGTERPNDVGHFVLALDPAFLRGSREAFAADMDRMVDTLRATLASEPETPVMVAGDPEYAAEDDRRRNGIPLPANFAAQLRTLAEEAGAPFVLGGTEP